MTLISTLPNKAIRMKVRWCYDKPRYTIFQRTLSTGYRWGHRFEKDKQIRQTIPIISKTD